jgi:hypothetical protein
MITGYVSQLESTAAELRKALNVFTPAELQLVPFEGSWSAAQVAEHVLKSASGVPVVLSGNSRPAERDPEEMVSQIRSIFLDMNTKMKSPEFILPSGNPPSKVELLQKLDKVFAKIEGTASKISLPDLFTDFPFPQMGYLTGYEWLCFISCHTQRHSIQIRNIYKAVAEKATSL